MQIQARLLYLTKLLINQLTQKITAFVTFDLHNSCYIALNCILSFLEKLFIWFCILFMESKVKYLLSPYI